MNLSTPWDKRKYIVLLEVNRPENTSNFRSVTVQALLSHCFLRQETCNAGLPLRFQVAVATHTVGRESKS